MYNINSSTMAAEQKDNNKISEEKYQRIARLYKAISCGSKPEITERLIDQQTDLNVCILPKSIRQLVSPAWLDVTLLHHAYMCRNKMALNMLLLKGADYTMKNSRGSTVLHTMIDNSFSDLSHDDIDHPYVDLILEAHATNKNYANPCNANGLTHFHVACAVNNTRVVELFLRNGVSVDHAVDNDSRIFAGYTSLHFAARFACMDVAELLMKYQVNARLKNFEGATALHCLVQKQLALIDQRNRLEGDYVKEDIMRNEEMMRLLLEYDEAVFHDEETGLSIFHVACTMLNTALTECLLSQITDVNKIVNENSPFWSGYTPLHFAALCNLKTVNLLLRRGGDIEAKNTEGTSVFDMCLERYHMSDIVDIISRHPIWKDIQFSDSGRVKLTDFIEALHNNSKLIRMARNYHINARSYLPLDCLLWPGSTPLHLAVILSERKRARFHQRLDEDEEYDSERLAVRVIKLFLNEKYFDPVADILAQDAYGRTAIHLAYRTRKKCTLDFLFDENDRIDNSTDIDHLSLLHIACSVGRQQAIKNLLSFTGNEDVNLSTLVDVQDDCYSHDMVLRAGSTPLHIATSNEDKTAMKILLSHSADPFLSDADGITSIHRALATRKRQLCRIFTSIARRDDNAKLNAGVTSLHLACVANDRRAVKKLLNSGADANATILTTNDDCSNDLLELFEFYEGWTPLCFALEHDSLEAVEVLLSRGADPLQTKELSVTDDDQVIPIVQILRDKCGKYANVLLSRLRYDQSMREKLKVKTGLTMLHIACNALDVEAVRSYLDCEDVNAQAHLDSIVWPGCTPIHILLKNLGDRLDNYGISRNSQVDNFHVVLKLLINRSVDLTLKNADGDTPIDLSKALCKRYMNSKTWLCMMLPSENCYYQVNFVDQKGMSLFHGACYRNHIGVVKDFLSSSDVDVNQRVDEFYDDLAGYTPLHFAAKQCWTTLIGTSLQSTTIELLLDHGANVHATDVHGYTPLHTLVQRGSNREQVMLKLIRSGAKVNATNMYGNTVLEVLLKSTEFTNGEMAVLLQNGARLNDYNNITGIGCFTLIYDSYDLDYDALMKTIFANTKDIIEADDLGRTIIHNLVCCRMAKPPGGLSALCGCFMERGCDIDQQDAQGRTPLHLAVQWQNFDGIVHLLMLNADASIVDNNGKTAIDYALELCDCCKNCEDAAHADIREALALQAFKLEWTGFQEFARYRNLEKIDNGSERIPNIRKNLKKARRTYIISGELTLYDFASETGAIGSYLHMPLCKQKLVDDFFKMMDNCRFGKISYWLTNHYRKAVARSALIELAKESLHRLLDLPLPDLCSDRILRFLSNIELKNLIAADDCFD